MSGRARVVVGRSGGFTVAEALVALLLSYLMMALALGALARQREVLQNLAARSERLAAARLTRHVLLTEARAAAGEGAYAAGSDSLALRAFRGHALVCPGPVGERELQVRAEGVRAPDPAKDSVLLLLASGVVAALALLDRSPSAGPCPGGAEPPERWTLSGPVPPGVVEARWFERGTYYLTEGALRYRRGQAGRQPLTPEVLRRSGSAFRPGLERVGVFLVFDVPRSFPDSWSFSMRVPPGG
jgi:hypothetical protein